MAVLNFFICSSFNYVIDMKLFLLKPLKVILMFCLIIFCDLRLDGQNTYYTTCAGSSIAISGAPAQTIKLFSQFSGGIAIGTGLSVATPILNNSTTFSNASLPRIPVFVAVNPVPSATTSSSQSAFCLGGSTTLTATPTSSIENKHTFVGTYDISNSAIKNFNTNGGISTGFFPDSLVLISSGDNGSGNPGFSEYAFKANASGSIQFNWHFTCQDGSIYDYPTIAINNGTFNYFNSYALSSSVKNQRGMHTQIVNAGDTVRLRIETVDNFGPEGRCVISGFIAPAPASVNVEWYASAIAGVVLGSGNTYSVTPSTSGIKNFYAQTMSTNTCTTATRTIVGINVYPLPVFSISGPSSLCAGQNLTLTATGNSNFVWSDNVVNGVPFTPFFSTKVFKLVATTSNGCIDSAFKSVTVNSAPSISIIASPLSGQVCVGSTVTATDSNGCSNSASQLITVNSLPSISINTVPASGLVCFGASATLTASGANTYSWTGGITNGQSFIPSSTSSYSVTATDANGCTNTQSRNITVTSLPVLSVTAVPASATICSGSGMSLFGNGASTYIWSGGVVNGTIFNPSVSNVYTLTGIGANGCSNTITQSVTVNSLPTLSINVLPINATVCNGEVVTLTASGAATYAWSGGISNGVSFSANSANSFNVTGTDSNGCSTTLTQTLTILPAPNLNINAIPVSGIVCAGSSFTLTGTGANTYSWTGGLVNGQAFTPSASGTYVLTGIGSNNCTATDSFSVSIQTNLDYTTSLSGSTISAIQTGANYQWLDCTSNTLIPAQTNQSFSPTLSGLLFQM
jgi:hypothetical protein